VVPDSDFASARGATQPHDLLWEVEVGFTKFIDQSLPHLSKDEFCIVDLKFVRLCLAEEGVGLRDGGAVGRHRRGGHFGGHDVAAEMVVSCSFGVCGLDRLCLRLRWRTDRLLLRCAWLLPSGDVKTGDRMRGACQ
jgi:hypothetical protein